MEPLDYLIVEPLRYDKSQYRVIPQSLENLSFRFTFQSVFSNDWELFTIHPVKKTLVKATVTLPKYPGDCQATIQINGQIIDTFLVF